MEEIKLNQWKKIETTDKKVHNLQLTQTQIGRKRKREVSVIDFISVRGQQDFEEKAEINAVEIKIENDKIQKIKIQEIRG